MMVCNTVTVIIIISLLSLLAPTGSLIATMDYYISTAAAATFSDFHSVN